MGLNRMMMKKDEVTVEDGNQFWEWKDLYNVTISFTVPPGVKRIKIQSKVDFYGGKPDEEIDAIIKNASTNKIWGEGWFTYDSQNHIDVVQNIDAIVGVTPNKTYSLFIDCHFTDGVTFSWGKAINAMTPTVEDY